MFGDDIKILYMDTYGNYSKLNMDHEKYKKIIEENSQHFGKNIGLMKPEMLNNRIVEFFGLSSKCYSYICKDDIKK